jgi:hypothetical protein
VEQRTAEIVQARDQRVRQPGQARFWPIDHELRTPSVSSWHPPSS